LSEEMILQSRDKFLKEITIEGKSLSALQDDPDGKYKRIEDTSENPYKPDENVYKNRLDCIFEAGVKLVEDLILPEEKNFYMQKINELKEKCHSELSGKDPTDDKQHKSAVKIIAKATKNIAEVMAEAELNR